MKTSYFIRISSLVLFLILVSCESDLSSSRPFYEADRDITIIPDKYNTGVDKNIVLNKLDADGDVNGVYIKIRTDASNDSIKTNYIITSYSDNLSKLKANSTIENYDFSDAKMVIYNPDRYDEDKTITFRNCKFKGFANAGPYDNNKVTCKFEHCSFSGGVSEMNISLNWCYIGGFPTDAMNPLKNFTVTNTFVCDLQPEGNTNGTHIDGFQIYGRKGTVGGNIHFDNVRFEMPSFYYEGNTSAVNACMMFQLEFGDVVNCSFNNMICNGGGKWYPMYVTNGKGSNKFNQQNLYLANTWISDTFGPIYYPTTFDNEAHITNTDYHHEIYVSSVWKDENQKTHIITSNDTHSDKVLTVQTDKGQFTFDIPHCPSNWATLEGVPSRYFRPEETVTDDKGRNYQTYRYKDMPFDIDCVIDENVSFIKCFDGDIRIRYVRF